MTKIWTTKSREEIKQTVFGALEKNVNYKDLGVLGIPASYLDQKVFSQDASFLKDAPFMSAMVSNPNHIGCHTLGNSEHFFGGTQAIEKELMEICAVDILQGEPNQQDGYVASGGTEANIQAIWVYRNYFRNKFGASHDEIVILCSADSHYSMDKAANLLHLDIVKIAVDFNTRELLAADLDAKIEDTKLHGKRYFIVVANMMTTMFGSVDDVDVLTQSLKKHQVEFKLHVDGAYGGFYYPFAQENSRLTFQNPDISSFTLDAHKMAQAPYGTGIFLIRKDLIQNANTKEASYVEGEDFTLIGSRSGANAVAVWMILSTYGPHAWFEKILVLQRRTDWLCAELNKLGIVFYRNPNANIVTIKAEFMHVDITKKFGLVPDNHLAPNWYKVVVMDHVSLDKLAELVAEFRAFENKYVDLNN